MFMPLVIDAPMAKDGFDLMSMEVYIDGNNSGNVLEDFPLEDINPPPTNFDFLYNFQEPHFETPPTAPELVESGAPVKNDADNGSPIYITIKDNAETGKSEISEEVPDVFEIPKLVIMKPPLCTVAKKPSKKQKEVMALLEELDKLSKAEIFVPVIGVNSLRPRMRKQNLNLSVNRSIALCTTPTKKKHDISKVRKQLFPSDSPGKENDEPEIEKEKMDVKVEDKPEIREKIIATRRSLRNNTSCNIQEIYFSCDMCRKIFKDKKLLLHHRKTHSKASQ